MAAALMLLTLKFVSGKDLSFDEWVRAHDKVYQSEQERQHREAIFHENTLRVLHEAEPGVSYTTSGPFADLEPQEFAKRLMPKRPVPEILEQRQRPEHTSPLPKSFDWQDKGLVAPIRDQQALGSCWAVSTAETLEGQLAKKTGKIVPLSPEQLIECDASADSKCAGDKGCADCGMFGGWPYLAYQFLQKAGGIFSEADWPYASKDQGMYPCMPEGYNKAFCGNHDDLYCRANSTKGQGPHGLCHASSGFATAVTGWKSLSRNETELAQQLVQYGPLSVLIVADSLQFYHSGVWKGGILGCQPDPSEGILGLDHAVLLVGFGEEKDILGRTTPYWRLKNSWGSKWGEEGYFRLERNTGRCGVNLAPTLGLVTEENLVV
ncbi:unnamed protein product [Effrenium voratum]|nr:unnamed protein product [Effrenium voratum]